MTPLRANLAKPGGCPADDRQRLPSDAGSLAFGVGSNWSRRPRAASSTPHHC